MLETPCTLFVIIAVTFFVEYTGAAHVGLGHGVDVGTAADVPRADLSANATIPVLYSGNQTPPRDESMFTLVGFAMYVREGSGYSV